MNYKKLANKGILQIDPYVPGKAIASVQRELGLKDIVKLASNENPLGPSPLALQAAQQVCAITHLYPDSSGFELKQAIAAFLSIQPEQIILGNGSDNILHLIAYAFLNPDKEAVVSQYAFATFSIAIQAAGAKLLVVPTKEFAYDLHGMLAAITERTRVIYLANPENPTGRWFSEAQLLDFLRQIPRSLIVVLDEAYYEYMCHHPAYPNAIELLPQFPNLLITRTFSKAYGLAGLRVGYGIGLPQMLELLNRIRTPFNVATPAMAAAQAALKDTTYLEQTLRVTAQGRRQMLAGLQTLGLQVISRAGNFVTVDVQKEGVQVAGELLKHGIIVRPLANYGLNNYLRVSIGLLEQNQRFLEVLQKLIF